jgi:hypothetical protein
VQFVSNVIWVIVIGNSEEKYLSSDECASESDYGTSSVMARSESFCFVAMLVHLETTKLITQQNQVCISSKCGQTQSTLPGLTYYFTAVMGNGQNC